MIPEEMEEAWALGSWWKCWPRGWRAMRCEKQVAWHLFSELLLCLLFLAEL